MDLNDIAGSAPSLRSQGDDGENQELVMSEMSEDATIEYVTVRAEVGPGNGEVGTFHCDPSDPTIVYDADGQPVNMDDLNPQEKEVIMAVQEHLAINRQEDGDIKEESESEEAELLPPEALTSSCITTASDDVALSATMPQPGNEDVIASAMMQIGFDEQSGGEGDQEKASLDSGNITYWIVPQGSSRGRDKLYDSMGHSYTLKSKNQVSITWRCKMRTKKFCCKARVIQRGDQFTKAGEQHNHDTSGKFIQIVKPEPPQTVRSVQWDVTPLPIARKRKKKVQEISFGQDSDDCDQLNASAKVLRIAFDEDVPASSSTPTVVIVETSIPPRNKRKASTPRQVLKTPIKHEVIERKFEDVAFMSDSDESPDLQDSDDLISPGFRKVKRQAEQDCENPEQKDEEECFDSERDGTKMTYRIVRGGSARRCDKLFDSLGFSYTVKRINSDSVTWRCTCRQKHKLTCAATVKQWGKRFIASDVAHNHKPRFADELHTVLTQKVKQIVQTTPGKPIPEIAREQIGQMVESGVPENAIPKLDNLLRKAHHLKRKTLLQNPKTIDFKLDRSLIPTEFLRDDLKIVDARHLIFATEQQLKLLQHSKLWYIDCAICAENRPFYQLLTVHVFVKRNETIKQIPALFAFMSRKTLDDYTAVLRSIKLCCEGKLKLKKVVLQFESSMWNAFNSTFPDVKISGCTYHFQQCVYDTMVELGLKDSFENDEAVKVFAKQLMSLSLVPYVFVGVMFTPMERRAPTKELADLCSNFRKMWLETSVWTLKNITGFDTPIRTEEDTLGWNRCLNGMGWSTSSLYMMVQQLFNEFSSECEGCHAVSEKELKLYQRKHGSDNQRKIFKLWKAYQNGGKSPKGLLKSLAQYTAY